MFSIRWNGRAFAGARRVIVLQRPLVPVAQALRMDMAGTGLNDE